MSYKDLEVGATVKGFMVLLNGTIFVIAGWNAG
jgi:hypothetical protein